MEPAGTKDCALCGTAAPIAATRCSACGGMFGVLSLGNLRQPHGVPAGLMCTQHLESNAVATCFSCSSGVCATCDFLLPGGQHFCPACIDNAGTEEVSSKRRNLAIAAIVLAVWCTLFFPFTISGALYRALGSTTDLQSFGCFVALFLLAPSILGTVLAVSAYDKRFRNTPLIWTARIWNFLILAVLIVQVLVRTF